LKAATKRPRGNNRIKISFSTIYFITFITINKKLKKNVSGDLWRPLICGGPGALDPVLNPALRRSYKLLLKVFCYECIFVSVYFKIQEL
jgi:hypothetical protein